MFVEDYYNKHVFMSVDVALHRCGREADDVLDENWDFPLPEAALVG